MKLWGGDVRISNGYYLSSHIFNNVNIYLMTLVTFFSNLKLAASIVKVTSHKMCHKGLSFNDVTQTWGILDPSSTLHCKNHFFLNPPTPFVIKYHFLVACHMVLFYTKHLTKNIQFDAIQYF